MGDLGRSGSTLTHAEAQAYVNAGWTVFAGNHRMPPEAVPDDATLVQWSSEGLTVADANGVTMADVQTIASNIAAAQRAAATAAITPLIQSAQSTANQALAAATRSITTPVPTQVVDADYAAQPSDQRFLHRSDGDHTLTLLDPKDAYDRVFLVLNDGPGVLTVVSSDGSAAATLTAGQTVQVLATFVPGAGDDQAPADLQVNGQPVAGTGAYVWRVYNRLNPALAGMAQQVAELQAEVTAVATNVTYTAGTTLSSNHIVRLADGLVYPADATADTAAALQSVVGMTAGAAQAGQPVVVTRAGPVPGMAGLTPDAVYFLAAAGSVTTAVPTSGTLQIVGTGQTDAVFNVRLAPPVHLNP